MRSSDWRKRFLRLLSRFNVARDAEQPVGHARLIAQQRGVRLDPDVRAVLAKTAPLDERRLAAKHGEVRIAGQLGEIVGMRQREDVFADELRGREAERFLRRRRVVERRAVEILQAHNVVDRLGEQSVLRFALGQREAGCAVLGEVARGDAIADDRAVFLEHGIGARLQPHPASRLSVEPAPFP